MTFFVLTILRGIYSNPVYNGFSNTNTNTEFYLFLNTCLSVLGLTRYCFETASFCSVSKMRVSGTYSSFIKIFAKEKSIL